MGSVRVLSRRGDDRIAWDMEGVTAGDAVESAAAHEAERILYEQRARGATAPLIEQDRVPVRIDHFDASAKQVLILPRVVRG
jgi:hypothetical protein